MNTRVTASHTMKISSNPVKIRATQCLRRSAGSEAKPTGEVYSSRISHESYRLGPDMAVAELSHRAR